MNHYPKGGMCATCKHKYRNCSHLAFHKMPVIERKERDVSVVLCREYDKEVG